jgi:predicted DNA-binding protein (MmcQ/YjbR family)
LTASTIQRAELALRDIAMAYPEAHEDFPWGERAIKIKGKVFLFMHASPELLSLTTKLPASSEMALLLPYVSPTGYGLGKSGWVTAKFGPHDEAPIEMLRAWIDESFRAVAPKRVAAQIAATERAPAAASAAKKPAATKPARAGAKQVAKARWRGGASGVTSRASRTSLRRP